MGIRDILKDGEPSLRQKSREVSEFDAKLSALLDDLWETMKKAEGVGLASPQVGILRRVAVVAVGETRLELVNPKILSTHGEQVGAEGCLSVPDRSETVKRPEKITLEFFDRAGKKHKKTVDGLLARACCHEIDHLDGVLYYDRAGV